MNSRLVLAIGLLVLPLMQARSQNSQISVSGSAEVKVTPDEIYLSVGVETRDSNLPDAKRQNDEQIAKALGFLKRAGLPDKDVKTDYINVEPSYDHNISRLTPLYYQVQKSIEVKLTKIETFEGLLTGLLTNGVTHVHGVEFRTSQLRKHRDAARAAAIRAAKEKAEALAAELSVKIGKVSNINANDYWGGGWSGSSGYWGGRSGGGGSQNSSQNQGGAVEKTDGTLSIGQVSISASVNVTFAIE